ncbi:hypothetical protein IFM89_024233 [Coptis chinensis]|uniref:Uncharacterized protein n=1 Tax=Coptis chinensis TaxID=261450 RepID=A0A835GXP4_9MAGN|nr:hypothetical protein IFM89_024233 [Coptis chinensis]
MFYLMVSLLFCLFFFCFPVMRRRKNFIVIRYSSVLEALLRVLDQRITMSLLEFQLIQIQKQSMELTGSYKRNTIQILQDSRECMHHATNAFMMDEALGCARVKVQFGENDKQIEVKTK